MMISDLLLLILLISNLNLYQAKEITNSTKLIQPANSTNLIQQTNSTKLIQKTNSTKGFYDPKVFYNTSLYEGDIINFNGTADKYHATSEVDRLWPGNTLVYEIDESLYHIQDLIMEAMKHITSSTDNCIQFKKRSFETSYVYIYSNKGCYSAVGRQGGAQEMSLGTGCQVIGVILHEILHALGFYHYHSRSDRDQYIQINYDNILPEMVPQFKKLNSWQEKIYTTFDYESIMIYGSTAFSKDGILQTMVPIKSNVLLRDPGYKSSLTDSDVTSLKSLYNCPSGKVYEAEVESDTTLSYEFLNNLINNNNNDNNNHNNNNHDNNNYDNNNYDNNINYNINYDNNINDNINNDDNNDDNSDDNNFNFAAEKKKKD